MRGFCFADGFPFVARRGISMEENEIVSVDPKTLSGTPVFTRTRVPVASLIAHLDAGDTLEEFVEGSPGVRREQAEAFLAAQGRR
jgi:uncharacterized protein (DUF433 family)